MLDVSGTLYFPCTSTTSTLCRYSRTVSSTRTIKAYIGVNNNYCTQKGDKKRRQSREEGDDDQC